MGLGTPTFARRPCTLGLYRNTQGRPGPPCRWDIAAPRKVEDNNGGPPFLMVKLQYLRSLSSVVRPLISSSNGPELISYSYSSTDLHCTGVQFRVL